MYYVTFAGNMQWTTKLDCDTPAQAYHQFGILWELVRIIGANNYCLHLDHYNRNIFSHCEKNK